MRELLMKDVCSIQIAGDSFTAEYEILREDLSQLSLEATEALGRVRYMYDDFVTFLE